MSEPTRVLVVDDHTIVRQGLVGILKAHRDIAVVGEAADGNEAAEKAVELQPDIVILDLSMPRLNGLEAARRIRKTVPKARILILTMHDDNEYVLRMVKAGASGYLVKDRAASELIEAIHALRAGKAFFDPLASKALAEAYEGDRPFPDDPYARLTAREREVFQLIVEGHTTANIGDVLGISAKTVENHRARLMAKLDVHSVAELLRHAARHGLLR